MRHGQPRRIIVASLPTTDPNKFIEVQVHYTKGGINYFTYAHEQRGYFLSISPITEDGQGFKSFTAFSGTKTLLLATARFARKILQEVARTALEHEKYPALLAHVLNKNGITLESPAETPAPA